MPKKLKSKVFWILIGTNDFLKDDVEYCSVDVVLMGIKRIIGEIQIQKPEATIVVNGLLPRASKAVDGRLYSKNKDEISIMDGIDSVNQKLREFCDLHESLHFFDAKDIFIDNKESVTEGSFQYIPQYLMSDYLHPTALGYQRWGVKIIEELRTLIDGRLELS